MDAAYLRLRRFLVAVRLTTVAEEARRVDAPETNATALLAAHAACEALLGLLSGVSRHKQGEEVTFYQLVERAKSQVDRFPADLVDDLTAMHRIRVDFVHASTTVHAEEASRATSAARRLMGLGSVAPVGQVLAEGGGIATAVAEAIQVEAVGMWLRHAERMRNEGRPRLAADGLARALDGALARTKPRLIPRTDPDAFVREMRRLSAGMGFDTSARAMAQQIEDLTTWVVPLALGISPASYARLREVVGSEGRYDTRGAPRQVHRPSKDEPSDTDLQMAIGVTSEIILRIWAIGSLESLRSDDSVVEQAQPFLENPSGWAAGELPT